MKMHEKTSTAAHIPSLRRTERVPIRVGDARRLGVIASFTLPERRLNRAATQNSTCTDSHKPILTRGKITTKQMVKSPRVVPQGKCVPSLNVHAIKPILTKQAFSVFDGGIGEVQDLDFIEPQSNLPSCCHSPIELIAMIFCLLDHAKSGGNIHHQSSAACGQQSVKSRSCIVESKPLGVGYQEQETIPAFKIWQQLLGNSCSVAVMTTRLYSHGT
mmetsp:Transcript_21513/g.52338  ORF Transcript_21513/g.52338 Transcript_21513/m.52338 type:complete len:216 (-) Transcript_21513:14-661(-)